jgi:hypothetical protein
MVAPASKALAFTRSSPNIGRAYSDSNTDVSASIPVYLVASQTLNYDPPNTQDNISGAIPVNLTTLGAIPNAIPIRIVSGTGPGPTWGNNQGIDTNAIPIFYSGRADAIPVWNTGITGVTRNPGGASLGIISTAPMNWAKVPGSASLTLTKNSPSRVIGTGRVPGTKTTTLTRATPVKT